MIKNISISNFKSARDLSIDCRPITVLTGLNGSGKSTVLQTIALLNQSQDSGKFLALKGSLTNLGKGEDVLFEGANETIISFKFDIDDDSFCVSAQCKYDDDRLKILAKSQFKNIKKIFKAGFQFLQADRIVPASLYVQADPPDRASGWLGAKGEFTIDYLARNSDSRVDTKRTFQSTEFDISEELIKHVAPTVSLIDQTSAWLQLISPGVKPLPQVIEENDTSALRFSYTGTSVESGSGPHRPTNVGFGITYCLPIITACLSAKKGALLMIENPEAHLHPMGQFALGCLLARCASDGVQIICETHSDHIMNGIRVEVKRKRLKPEQIRFHYFKRDLETGECDSEALSVFSNGKMNNWPKGFFDQWTTALDILLDE